MMMIPVDKIRVVIGKGGEQIDKIIEECNDVKIDIEDDGRCIIYHTDLDSIRKAKEIISNLIREAKIDDVYDATVTEVRDSFAFVNLFQGTDALLHVSELSWERTPNIKDVLKEGDTIRVKVISIDDAGKVKVSAKQLLEKPEGYEEKKKEFRPRNNTRRSNDSSNVERRVFKKKEQ